MRLLKCWEQTFKLSSSQSLLTRQLAAYPLDLIMSQISLFSYLTVNHFEKNVESITCNYCNKPISNSLMGRGWEFLHYWQVLRRNQWQEGKDTYWGLRSRFDHERLSHQHWLWGVRTFLDKTNSSITLGAHCYYFDFLVCDNYLPQLKSSGCRSWKREVFKRIIVE